MKYAFVVTALLASVTIAAGRQPQFKSGVEVVYLDVTVQAPDGSIVRGLAKDDFLIYDEEVPQDVAVFSAEPAPISVGVLIDTSGSMTGERMAAAIRAADALGLGIISSLTDSKTDGNRPWPTARPSAYTVNRVGGRKVRYSGTRVADRWTPPYHVATSRHISRPRPWGSIAAPVCIARRSAAALGRGCRFGPCRHRKSHAYGPPTITR